MEQYGNTASYNVESVLHKNIVGSEYYNKTCIKLEDWGQVVDEIWETVSDVEPWMSGNARGASTAFCLLFRSVRTASFHCLSIPCYLSTGCLSPASRQSALATATADCIFSFAVRLVHTKPKSDSRLAAWCRLFVLKPTEEEVKALLDHTDSPLHPRGAFPWRPRLFRRQAWQAFFALHPSHRA